MVSMANSRQSVVGVNEVWEGLWLGAAKGITTEFLVANGITSLVWATPEITPPILTPSVSVLRVGVKDDPKEDLSPYFPQVANIFRDRQGGVAIVCRAGVSRSASLACAALLSHPDLNLTLRAAFLAIQKVRPIVRPNQGFFRQLIEYELSVRGEASVKMELSPYDSKEDMVPDIYLEQLRRDMEGGTFTDFIPL